jgi:hypothetical protein
MKVQRYSKGLTLSVELGRKKTTSSFKREQELNVV